MDDMNGLLRGLKTEIKGLAAHLQNVADEAPAGFSAKPQFDAKMGAAWEDMAENLDVQGLYSADRVVLSELVTAVSTALLDLESRVVALEQRLPGAE